MFGGIAEEAMRPGAFVTVSEARSRSAGVMVRVGVRPTTSGLRGSASSSTLPFLDFGGFTFFWLEVTTMDEEDEDEEEGVLVLVASYLCDDEVEDERDSDREGDAKEAVVVVVKEDDDEATLGVLGFGSDEPDTGLVVALVAAEGGRRICVRYDLVENVDCALMLLTKHPQKIEGILQQLLVDLVQCANGAHKKPAFVFANRRSAENVEYDTGSGISHTGLEHFSEVKWGSSSTSRSFAIMTRLLSMIYRIVKAKLIFTKREIYYTDVTLFRSQGKTDNAIENVYYLTANPKGVVAGNIDFSYDGGLVSCATTSSGIPIPTLITKVDKVILIPFRFTAPPHQDYNIRKIYSGYRKAFCFPVMLEKKCKMEIEALTSIGLDHIVPYLTSKLAQQLCASNRAVLLETETGFCRFKEATGVLRDGSKIINSTRTSIPIIRPYLLQTAELNKLIRTFVAYLVE
ncbi:meiotic recombination protein SPO11 [Pelomyxa schiedti]|nr:meiotic recombination protein SPO11 [Pelomyxa schiedti]